MVFFSNIYLFFLSALVVRNMVHLKPSSNVSETSVSSHFTTTPSLEASVSIIHQVTSSSPPECTNSNSGRRTSPRKRAVAISVSPLRSPSSSKASRLQATRTTAKEPTSSTVFTALPASGPLSKPAFSSNDQNTRPVDGFDFDRIDPDVRAYVNVSPPHHPAHFPIVSAPSSPVASGPVGAGAAGSASAGASPKVPPKVSVCVALETRFSQSLSVASPSSASGRGLVDSANPSTTLPPASLAGTALVDTPPVAAPASASPTIVAATTMPSTHNASPVSRSLTAPGAVADSATASLANRNAAQAQCTPRAALASVVARSSAGAALHSPGNIPVSPATQERRRVNINSITTFFVSDWYSLNCKIRVYNSTRTVARYT